MEPTMPMPTKAIIADLANSDQPLLSSRLAELSNLSTEELRFLEQVWATIESKRRRQIVTRLVELAEDNLELNFDSIFKSWLKDNDAEVQSKAIEGLWENEEVSLIDSLINLLELDSSEKVQAAAATALGKYTMLAEHKKLRPSYASRVCQTLLTVIGGESRPVEVRRRALEAVAPLSLPQVNKAIMKAYQSSDSRFRISAIYAMGKNCDCAWLPMLLKELTSDDAEIRYEAAGACGELGEEEVMPYLTQLINDPDVDIQMAAIQAVGKIGGSEAREWLEQCLNNPSEAIRQAAEQALDELQATEDPSSFGIP